MVTQNEMAVDFLYRTLLERKMPNIFHLVEKFDLTTAVSLDISHMLALTEHVPFQLVDIQLNHE